MLDERLKGNEYSTAALTGTILHQVFEVSNQHISFCDLQYIWKW